MTRVNGKAFESGKVSTNRYGKSVTVSMTPDICVKIARVQKYFNRFYLYGMYDRVCSYSLYGASCIRGMYTGGANRNMTTRGVDHLDDIIERVYTMLQQVASFMNMEYGHVWDLNDPDGGEDVLRGLPWSQLADGCELLIELLHVLVYLKATFYVDIKGAMYKWKYVIAYRNYAKAEITRLQLRIYRMFQHWMKAQQFNQLYIEEIGVFDFVIEFYKDMRNWCRATDQYMFDMVTHELSVALYQRTSSHPNAEIYAAFGLCTEMAKLGAAIVIQSAIKKYMMRRCIGIHKGKSQFPGSTLYHDFSFEKPSYIHVSQGWDGGMVGVMSGDATTNNTVPNIPSHHTPYIPVLSMVQSTIPGYNTWHEWYEKRVLSFLVCFDGNTVDEELENYMYDYQPRERIIESIAVRDDEDEDEDDEDEDDTESVEFDVLGNDEDDTPPPPAPAVVIVDIMDDDNE